MQTTKMWDGDILTNPPYKYAKEFIEHAMTIIPDGKAGGGSAVAYAWYEFQKGYKGVSIIKWIN